MIPRSLRRFSSLITFAGALLLPTLPAAAGTATWTGLGADADWLTNANWLTSTRPYSGSEGHNLVFGTSPRTALTVSQGVSIGKLTFSAAAPAYMMTFSLEPGWSSSFDNGIANNSAFQQTLIASGSPLSFWGGSITGDVKLVAREGLNGVTLFTFHDQASAGSSTIINEKSATFLGNSTEFWGDASAGSSTIINEAAASATTAGGSVQFYGNSTAASSTITSGANGGVTFRDNASAGSSHVTAFGSGNDAYSGSINFQGNADAGSATLVADGDSNTDSATIYFWDDSTGGSARIILRNGGVLVLNSHNSTTITVGSVEGDSADSRVDLSGHKRLIIGGTNTDTSFAGFINGNTDSILEKTGTGKFTLTGDSAGGLVVTQGTLELGGGTVGGTITNNASLIFNHTNSVTYSKVLSGGGTTTKKGSGQLTLSGANTFTGNLVVSEGTLRATTSASALGAGTATVTLAGGTLQLANNTALNFGRDTSVTANSSLVSGRTSGSAAAPTHTLGTLSIGGQTLGLTRGTNATGTAGIAFGDTTLTGSPTFNIGANAQLSLGAVGGGHGLAKSGPGTLSLTGVNTFTGTTTISGGTLSLGSAASLGAASAISVGSGATFNVSAVSGGFTLGSGQTITGAGSVTGAFTLGFGAHLAPGNSPGTLTFANGLAFNGGSALDFELGTGSDLLRISGGTLTGPASGLVTINLTNSGGFAPATYELFNFNGAGLSSFDVTDFTLGMTIAGYDYSFNLTSSSLELIATASAIPEPSTYAAFAGLAALCLVSLRRRRIAES